MMDWKQDVEVMDAVDTLAKATCEPLNAFLNSIGQYNDGTPIFAFLQIYGVFINRYCEYAKHNTEVDSMQLALSEIANHPTVQRMVANMMQKQLDRGLNI